MIPYSRQNLTTEDEEAVLKALHHPFLTQGPKIGEFEEVLCKTIGSKEAVACSSGSAALQLAYAACGINENSIGIVPAITFASTANAFKHLGADVLFCDVDPVTGLIDLNSLEESLKRANRRRKKNFTGVISPVSFAGKVAPLKDCRKLADKYDYQLVEDASHSPLAWMKAGKEIVRSCTCEWTDYATLSFHPVKHICCGEGGAVLCGTKEMAERPRRLASHGINKNLDAKSDQPWEYEQVELGWNFRLTDIQAALGISQVQRLASGITKRRNLAARYSNELGNSTFSKYFDLPHTSSGDVWHLYVIRFKKSSWRDLAYRRLRAMGIMTQVHYIPVYRHPYYQRMRRVSELPGAEEFYSGCLSIPLFPEMKKKEQQKVINALKKLVEELRN